MGHWSFWEWVAYSTLWVGAIILAVDGGLKWYPDVRDNSPRWFRSVVASPWWAFSPLGFVIFATLILFTHEFTPSFLSPSVDTARLEIVNWKFIPPGEPRPPQFGITGIAADIFIQNRSDVVVVSGVSYNFHFQCVQQQLSKDDEEKYMKMVDFVFDQAQGGGNEISPHDGMFFTVYDNSLTKEAWDNVLSGAAFEYFFLETQYSAMSHTRVTERCFFFTKDYPSVHSCLDHNRIFTKN
jgi:hypothetical protein